MTLESLFSSDTELKIDFHKPVLIDKVLEFLMPQSDGFYLDGTLGGGGHAEAILRASAPNSIIWGLDVDRDAILHCKRRLKSYEGRTRFFESNFADMDLLPGFSDIFFHGVLLDLGLSSHQIDSRVRGFSYQITAPLDMRMSQAGKLTAEEIINEYRLEELAAIFKELGEERRSRKIALAIVRAREIERIRTSSRLVEIIKGTISSGFEHKSVARIFQALRIYVNDELNSLKRGLKTIVEHLNDRGRLVVISYHSLEDRIVKNFFKYLELTCICPPGFPECRCDKIQTGIVLTKKIVRPTSEEVAINPRAKSARLRAFERLIKV